MKKLVSRKERVIGTIDGNFKAELDEMYKKKLKTAIDKDEALPSFSTILNEVIAKGLGKKVENH